MGSASFLRHSGAPKGSLRTARGGPRKAPSKVMRNFSVIGEAAIAGEAVRSGTGIP
jgi:hypothetical protein